MNISSKSPTLFLLGIATLCSIASLSHGKQGELHGKQVKTIEVRELELPMVYRAVGSIHPSTEAKVMSQASGRVLETKVEEGVLVEEGEEMAVIEDEQLRLRLSQARYAAVMARAQKLQAEHEKIGALAALSRARSEFERVKKMHASQAATEQQLEEAEAAFKQAQSSVAGADEAVKGAAAALNRAEDAVKEVKVALSYTRVKAPFKGLLSQKLVDPGDLAWPGRPLYHLISPSRRRLEANVRESLAGKIEKGQKLKVSVDALDKTFQGIVEEVAPSADPSSRTFQVKVALGENKRLLPGMFGRLLIPLGKKKAFCLPKTAIRIIGQLSMVYVKTDGDFKKRFVRLGKEHEAGLEILSGITEGEVVASNFREVAQ